MHVRRRRLSNFEALSAALFTTLAATTMQPVRAQPASTPMTSSSTSSTSTTATTSTSTPYSPKASSKSGTPRPPE